LIGVVVVVIDFAELLLESDAKADAAAQADALSD
jgi:hypothetical protein